MSAIRTMIEIAEAAFWKGNWERQFRRPMKVGEHYANLPEDIKEKLKNLKSDDFKNIRFDAIDFMCYPMESLKSN